MWFPLVLSEKYSKLSKASAGARKRTSSADRATWVRMGVSDWWTRGSFWLRSLNAKEPSWPLWAPCCTIRVPAAACTVIMRWPAAGFTMCFTTGHSSVSKAYFLGQWPAENIIVKRANIQWAEAHFVLFTAFHLYSSGALAEQQRTFETSQNGRVWTKSDLDPQ